MSREDCGYRPPSRPRTGCKCDRCEAVRAKYQEKRQEQRRARYANDPEWRAKRDALSAAWKREKWANDPEYRAQQQASVAAWKREKWANDPEYRAKRNAYDAAWRQEKYQALCDEVDAIQLTQEDVMDVIWESLK